MKQLFLTSISILTVTLGLTSCSFFGDLGRKIPGTSSTPDPTDSFLQFSAAVDANYECPESLALSESYAVIGCYPENPQGGAYIYYRDQGGTNQWGLEKKLLPVSPEGDSSFGQAVSLSGDMAAVSAPGDDAGGLMRGKVYLHSRDQGGPANWGLVKTFLPTVPSAFNSFGYRICLNSGLLAVSARIEISNLGSVYLYGKDTGGTDNWGLIKKFSEYRESGNPSEEKYYGKSAAIDGDTLAIGYPMTTRCGSVHIYYRNSGGTDNWGLVKSITVSDNFDQDNFGQTMALSGNTLVVGSTDTAHVGAIYIFYRNSGGTDNWGLEKVLYETNVNPCNYYGESVSLYQDTIAVGAIGEHVDGMYRGKVFLYQRNNGGTDNWGWSKSFIEAERTDYNAFGKIVFLSGSNLFIGTATENIAGSYFRKAYLYQDIQ